MSVYDEASYVSACWAAFDARRAYGESSRQYKHAIRVLDIARARREITNGALPGDPVPPAVRADDEVGP